MAVNLQYLARAVVHWVEFEDCCLRGSLFSEAYLSHPIGQTLNARSKNPVEPELPHPVLNQVASAGRTPAIDFAVRTRNGNVITDAIETKWITEKRDFKQEVFDDLVRLELIHTPNRDIGRWLLLAGRYSHIRSGILDAEGNAGAEKPRQRVFEPVLSDVVSQRCTVPIRDSAFPARRHWEKSNKRLGIDIAISLTTTLVTRFPEPPLADAITCFIWRVGRVGRRSVFSFT